MSLGELLDLQSGVVARRQLLEAGLEPSEVRRMLRRRGLVVARSGVYVSHAGELSWLQRAWVEVLNAWPAALTHRSAIRAANGPGRRHGESGPVQWSRYGPARSSRVLLDQRSKFSLVE